MNDTDFVMTSPPCGSGPLPARPIFPRVLVADDDPTSCRFLCDGLRSLGAEAEASSSSSGALERARRQAFDLLLLDCRMPGGGALHILDELRRDRRAASAGSTAVATSAELEADDRRRLLRAGFSDTLLKPCQLADLQRVLAIVRWEVPAQAMLDDRAGLSSSGDAATMRALRGLLRDELLLLQRELDALATDRAGFAERLHRLRSSCGFCGATALAEQAAALQQPLSQHAPAPAALERFRQTLQATLQALNGQQQPGR
jgi:CheY-like chemotaxis protein